MELTFGPGTAKVKDQSCWLPSVPGRVQPTNCMAGFVNPHPYPVVESPKGGVGQLRARQTCSLQVWCPWQCGRLVRSRGPQARAYLILCSGYFCIFNTGLVLITVMEINSIQVSSSQVQHSFHQIGSFCLAYENSTKNISLLCPHLAVYQVTLLEQLGGKVTAGPRASVLWMNAQLPGQLRLPTGHSETGKCLKAPNDVSSVMVPVNPETGTHHPAHAGPGHLPAPPRLGHRRHLLRPPW